MIRYKHKKNPINLKKWRSNPNSSNVDKILYNDETGELVIRFNSGETYTYDNINIADFKDILTGNAECKTNGENEWGRWFVGKTPSVGAAVYEILVQTEATYRKGGSFR